MSAPAQVKEVRTIDPTWALLIGLLAGLVVAAVLWLVFTLVPMLNQIRRTAREFEEIAQKVKTQLDPTIHEAQGLVRDVSSLTRRVDGDLKVVSRIVEDVSDTTGYAKELAHTVKEEVERPMLGLISTVAGVRRGMDAFRGYRRRKKAPRNPLRHTK